MSVKSVAHVNFRGDARAALEFYQSVFGGDVAVVTYKDSGDVQDPAEADQVMWGQLTAGNGFHVMAYDVPSRLPPSSPAFRRSKRREHPTMRTRPLGRTGTPVSPSRMGTVMFGRVGGPGHDGCVRTVHRAVDAGIDVVDTADVSCDPPAITRAAGGRAAA
ncbi:VOC family protein [Streptosporangium carneum]|uniref:Glyoxalase/fosfomycin resistance/dioxygenase domain-containing protein n=1 Tax=Streptosporangium carneum TaxID=47481 RepID=A0A9W6MDU2_9ACTN|nr:VOC family protein [Streptosporangium carneum]GLK10511.1 hypothetical protein GCM10017600_39170 [Streptosporangium carneum]